MTDPIDHSGERFRVELDGGAAVQAGPMATGEPGVTITLSAARAHSLAHLLTDWMSAFRLAPDRADRPTAKVLSRAIEDAAAVLGEPGALACASRGRATITTVQRLAAMGVLHVREPALSPVERLAVVDAAARWMEEDAGDELAFALLSAACSSAIAANQAYVELLSPAPDLVAGGGTKREDER